MSKGKTIALIGLGLIAAVGTGFASFNKKAPKEKISSREETFDLLKKQAEGIDKSIKKNIRDGFIYLGETDAEKGIKVTEAAKEAYNKMSSEEQTKRTSDLEYIEELKERFETMKKGRL